MRTVLIISPNFPPINSADMHRVRQSLPYFKMLGWKVVIICVDEIYIELYSIDPLLLHSVPGYIEVHKVKALPVNYTRKFGLGSLSMRAYLQIKCKGNELLKKQHFDLIYFSTTAFHVMALGPGWKKRFKVPFILDIQDPWRNDFYLDKPASQRPPKFFISYNIDKWLECYTVPKADGIISVSQKYVDTFMQRYPLMKSVPYKVITFGGSIEDVELMKKYVTASQTIQFFPEKFNVIYIGRGGHDMNFALEIIFKALAKGLQVDESIFSKIHLWFIGTSYATAGKGAKTILPIAKNYNVDNFVTEISDRIPYFETLFLLDKADMLLVPGSTDVGYTASKIYPYMLAQKPLLALFYQESSVVKILNDVGFGKVIAFDHLNKKADDYVNVCMEKIREMILTAHGKESLNMSAFTPLTAKEKTKDQVDFFNMVVSKKAIKNSDL